MFNGKVGHVKKERERERKRTDPRGP